MNKLYENVRAYIDQLDNNIISFSERVSWYDPGHYWDPENYSCVVLNQIKTKYVSVFLIKTNQHIREGRLRFLGKKEKFLIISFPKKRTFFFLGVRPNSYAEICLAKTDFQIAKERFDNIALFIDDLKNKKVSASKPEIGQNFKSLEDKFNRYLEYKIIDTYDELLDFCVQEIADGMPIEFLQVFHDDYCNKYFKEIKYRYFTI